MKITRLDHVQLAMPRAQEEAARRFYVGLLGLREVAKPPELAARGGCWFEGQGCVLHLGVEVDFRPARKAHPALCVDDLEAFRVALDQAGAPVVPETEPPGVRHFYTADPFGNRIELIQSGDGFAR